MPRRSKGKSSPAKRASKSRRIGPVRRGYLLRDSTGEQRRLSFKAFIKTARKSREKAHDLLQERAAAEWDKTYPPSENVGDERYELRRKTFIQESSIRKLGTVYKVRRRGEQYFKSAPVWQNRKDPKTGRIIRDKSGKPRREPARYKSGPRKGRLKRRYYRKVKGRARLVSESTVRRNLRRWQIEGVASFLEQAYAIDPRDSKRLAAALIDADDPEIIKRLTEAGIDTDTYAKMLRAKRKRRKKRKTKRERKRGRK